MPAAATFAAAPATFDSGGRITGIIHDGCKWPLTGQWVLTFADGRRLNLQPHDQVSPVHRDGVAWRWTGRPADEAAQSVTFAVDWAATGEGAVRLHATVRTTAPLDLRDAAYVLELPRAGLVGGALTVTTADGATTVNFPAAHPADGNVFAATGVTGLTAADAAGRWTLHLAPSTPAVVQVTDHWFHRDESDERVYRLALPLHTGPWSPETVLQLDLNLRLTGEAPAVNTRIAVREDDELQPFIGFGANTCWDTGSPATDFTLDALSIAWARFNLDFQRWVTEQAEPGPELQRDFALMQRCHDAGVPYVLSLWRAPEDFYTPPPDGQPVPRFGRKIAPAQWERFLNLIEAYIAYGKAHYGTEPALFSFNEPDLGVDIGFSPEEHRDAIKTIGARFAARGFATQLLLGDTANARDTHRYVLPTANDPAAMRYVGALSFHSWGGATPAQYAAWGEVATWLNRPLFVGEAGMDPSSWRNRDYDAYDYGLRELAEHFNFINQARVQVSLYWQFTNDYGLVRPAADGPLQSTGRFWLMKHLTNLTPTLCSVVRTTSDTPDLRVMAFRKGATRVVHLLNVGPAATIRFDGLATGTWHVVTTGEDLDWATAELTVPESNAAGAPTGLAVPARSLLTLTLGATAAP